MAQDGKTMPWWSSKTDPTGAHLFFALLKECRKLGHADSAARAAWAKRTGEPCPYHATKPTPKKAYLAMPRTAYLDLETQSAADLGDCGVEVYSYDFSTDILCFCYALDDGPIKSWKRGDPFPADLKAHIEGGGTVEAHNANFEKHMWHVGRARNADWPKIADEQWSCSMAACAAMAFPQSLEQAAKAFGGKDLKDDEGKRLMMKLCKPMKNGIMPVPDEQQMARLIQYCEADVAAQRGLWPSGLLPLSPQELLVWQATQRMNDLGVRVDREAAHGIEALLEWSEKNLDEMVAATVGYKLNVRSPNEVKTWLASRGIHKDTLDKNDVKFLLSLADLPGDARLVLEARQQMSKSSTAKVRGILARAAEGDDRIRGNFKYHGATTGRWAGSGVQLQNLPKGDLSASHCTSALDDATQVSRGEMTPADWSLLWGDPFTVAPSLIRGLLVPKDGQVFVCADYSAIEGRVLAWLAGEAHVLQAYRDNLRLYAVAAAGIYKVPYAEIMAGRDRGEKKYKQMDAVGKCIELACGYQGGSGAFNSMAEIFGVKVPEDEAKAAIAAWRESRPKTVALWRSLEAGAVDATKSPGYVALVGPYVKLRHDGTHLWMRLPSGRKLCYPFARVEEREVPWGGTKGQVSCMSMNGMTKKWERDFHYGGSFTENLVQAVSRDIMAEAFLRVDAIEGMDPLALVHDEILCETLDTDSALPTLIQTMTQLPTWADASLPLSAEGWVGKRYQK